MAPNPEPDRSQNALTALFLACHHKTDWPAKAIEANFSVLLLSSHVTNVALVLSLPTRWQEDAPERIVPFVLERISSLASTGLAGAIHLQRTPLYGLLDSVV